MFFWSTGKGGIKCVSDFTLRAPEYKLYKYFIIINDLQGLIPNTDANWCLRTCPALAFSHTYASR